MKRTVKADVKTVPFKKIEVKRYLDRAIKKWRKRRDLCLRHSDKIGIYYIDAFQSVRLSLFGELLPKDPETKKRVN